MTTATKPRAAKPAVTATKELATTNAGRSEAVESWLREYGVKYTLMSVPLNLIDKAASLSNQARLSAAVNETVVDTYKDAVERGDKFPAGVIYERNGKLVIIDGNHRFLAHEAVGVENAPFYLLDPATRSDLVIKLTFEANTRHGMPNSLEDRIAHAVFLVENAAMTQRDAAAAVNVPYARLQQAWQRQQAERRAAKLGIPARVWDNFPHSTKVK